MKPISEAPQDKTRILICHYPRHFNRWREGLHLMEGYRSAPEPTWEECWWDSEYRSTRLVDGQFIAVEGRWTPWCGTYAIKSSLTIEAEHMVGWVSCPKIKKPEGIKRFGDGRPRPFISAAQYDDLRDDDKFLYNRKKD